MSSLLNERRLPVNPVNPVWPGVVQSGLMWPGMVQCGPVWSSVAWCGPVRNISLDSTRRNVSKSVHNYNKADYDIIIECFFNIDWEEMLSNIDLNTVE